MELPIFSNFLVPVDGGESSRRAKRYAVALAQKCDAKVHLFFAQGAVANTIGGDNRRKVKEKNAANIDKVFDIYRDGFHEAGVEYTTTVAEGEPAEAIMKAACDLECGMIIMGAKGQKGVKKVLGTVASKVSAQSPVPVLVVGTECDCTNSCGKDCMWKWRFDPVPNIGGCSKKG